MKEKNLLETLKKKTKTYKLIVACQITFISLLVISTISLIVFSSLLSQYQNDNINQLQSIENGTFAEKYPDLDQYVFINQVNNYDLFIKISIVLLVVSTLAIILFSLLKPYYKREKLDNVSYEVNDSL